MKNPGIRAEGDLTPLPTSREIGNLRRLQRLDSLLPALAAALDLRTVFERVSELAREVLPHDRLSLGLIDEARSTFVLHAAAGDRWLAVPDLHPIQSIVLPEEPWVYEIFADIQAKDSPFLALRDPSQSGDLHALLRVPIHLEGKLVGTVNFVSREVGAYDEDDVLVASRIRDHLALALSHWRLAEESRKAEIERERAAVAEERVRSLTEQLAAVGGRNRALGESPAFRDVLSQATKVASAPTTVLITGESGTGKEVLARFIHRASARPDGPFIAINCAALPETLLESELFGFEKGAFSGATASKPGRIEEAAGGVLFLDEIGEMSLTVQAKLLRFLQEREFQRLGSTRLQKADVRVITATNRDLKLATERGAFREDLFYRVSVFEIRVPPLRARGDDVLLLADAFLKDIARSLGRPAAGISVDARERLLGYRWPGNVRELHNVLERASILCEGGLITSEHLAIPAPSVVPAVLAASPNPATIASSPFAASRGDDLLALERATIERVLIESRFNKSRAAKRLGISRGQLYSKLEKHGLDSRIDPESK